MGVEAAATSSHAPQGSKTEERKTSPPAAAEPAEPAEQGEPGAGRRSFFFRFGGGG